MLKLRIKSKVMELLCRVYAYLIKGTISGVQAQALTTLLYFLLYVVVFIGRYEQQTVY